MIKKYVIYTNDCGTDAYELDWDKTPEEKYLELLKGEDQSLYYETSAIYVEIEDSEITYVWDIVIPELDNMTNAE
jgi:hypothetical protein